MVINEAGQVKLGDTLRWRNHKGRLLKKQYTVDRICKGREGYEWWILVDGKRDFSGGPNDSGRHGHWEVVLRPLDESSTQYYDESILISGGS